MIPGTSFSFGPNGLSFAKPVLLSIAYDQAQLPSGTKASDLSLAKFVDGHWVSVMSSGANDTLHKVASVIHGFSSYAVVINETKVSINAPNYALPGERSELDFTLLAPMNEAVTNFRAWWTTSGDHGRVMAWNSEGGQGGKIAFVDYWSNDHQVVPTTVYYETDNAALLGQTDSLTLEIRISFEMDPQNGTYYSSGAALSSVLIGNGGLRLYPNNLTCAPGEEITITPFMDQLPAGMTAKWNWRLDGSDAYLWEVEQMIGPGRTEILLSESPYIYFWASHRPTDESVGLPFQFHAASPAGRTTIGWMMAALLRMFLAALRPAFSLCPQQTQQKSARVGLLADALVQLRLDGELVEATACERLLRHQVACFVELLHRGEKLLHLFAIRQQLHLDRQQHRDWIAALMGQRSYYSYIAGARHQMCEWAQFPPRLKSWASLRQRW